MRTSDWSSDVCSSDLDYRPGASGDGRPGLGVGQIVGESFSIFFRRIHWFALLAFVPQLIAGLLLIPMVGGLAGYAGLVAGSMETDDFARGGPAWLVGTAISLFLTMLGPRDRSGLDVYEAQLGRGIHPGKRKRGGTGKRG